jgi:hypothetical protein
LLAAFLFLIPLPPKLLIVVKLNVRLLIPALVFVMALLLMSAIIVIIVNIIFIAAVKLAAQAPPVLRMAVMAIAQPVAPLARIRIAVALTIMAVVRLDVMQLMIMIALWFALIIFATEFAAPAAPRPKIRIVVRPAVAVTVSANRPSALFVRLIVRFQIAAAMAAVIP